MMKILRSVLRGLGWKQPCPHDHQRIVGVDGDQFLPREWRSVLAHGLAKHECEDCGYVWNEQVRIVGGHA